MTTRPPVLSLAGAFAAAALMVVAEPPADTAMFRGGPEHRGVYSSATPQLTSVAWKYHTEGRVLSSPPVDAQAVYVGSTDGRVYALDRATGAERWRFQ